MSQSEWGRDEELAATAKMLNADDPSDAMFTGSVRDRSDFGRKVESITWGRIKEAFYEGSADGETSIGLILSFAQGEENWIAVPPSDPGRYPGEVWYEKSAMYYLYIQFGAWSFITDGFLSVSFTVRFSETEGHWQLVQWRDDI